MNGYVKDMMCDSNNDVHYYTHDHIISHEHDIHVHNNNHNGFQSFSHVDNDCLKNNFDTIDWHSNGHEQLMSQYVTQDANENQNQAQYQTLFALNNESEIQPSSCSPPSQPIMNAHAHKPMKTSNLKSKSSSSKKSNTNKKELTHKLPKPVSAYALFFRDAQALIKGSNPNASFGEISKVVASNWENLDKVNKDIYKHRADQEKKNYLKSLASSRAKMVAGMMENAGKQSNVINDDGNHGQHDGDHAPVDTPVGSSSTTHNDSQQQIPSSNTHASEGTNFENENEERNDLEIVAHSLQTNNSNVCIRSGCGKPAIESQEWDNEYCSSECCVKHCSDVFNAWVAEQQQQQQQLQQQQQANQAQ